MLYFRLLIFFKINFFEKFFQNSLDSDQARQNVKQFGSRSGFKMFDILMELVKEFFEKVDFEKKSANKKNMKITQ